MNNYRLSFYIALVAVLISTSCEPRLTVRDIIIGDWEAKEYYMKNWTDTINPRPSPKITFRKDGTYSAENFPIPITEGNYYTDIGERLFTLSDYHLLYADSIYIRDKYRNFTYVNLPGIKLYNLQWYINTANPQHFEMYQYFNGLNTTVKAYGKPEGEYFPISLRKIK